MDVSKKFTNGQILIINHKKAKFIPVTALNSE